MKKNLLMLLCAVSFATCAVQAVDSPAAPSTGLAKHWNTFKGKAEAFGQGAKQHLTDRFGHWAGVEGQSHNEDVLGDAVVHALEADQFDGLDAGNYWATQENPTEAAHYLPVVEDVVAAEAFRPVTGQKRVWDDKWYNRRLTGAIPNLASILGRGAAWGATGYGLHKNRAYNWLLAKAQQRLAERNFFRRMLEHRLAKYGVGLGVLGAGFVGDKAFARITDDPSAAGAIGRGTAATANFAWDKAKAGAQAIKNRFRSNEGE